MSDSIPQRPCSVCKRSFPITSEFWHKHKKMRGGFSTTCKECAKARARQWTAENPEQAKATSAQYYLDHSEHIKGKVRQWALDNSERAKARRHDYYQRNQTYFADRSREWVLAHPEQSKRIKQDYVKRHPERRLASSRAWHERNRERSRQNGRDYRKNNPDKTKAYCHARRAREHEAEGFFTAEDIRIAYRAQRGKCWHCFTPVGDTFHADHLISLKNGGTNWPNNIVISCVDCNLKKGSKHCYQWNKRLF